MISTSYLANILATVGNNDTKAIAMLYAWSGPGFTANASSNPSFQWKRNGQDVMGATNDTWGTAQLNNNDVISVVFYSDHKCPVSDSAVSNAIDILIDLGVDDITGGSILLYPNSGSFTLKGEVANNKTIDLTIINELGQTVHQTTIRPQHDTIDQQININKELASGVYLLQLRMEDGVSTMKLHIKENQYFINSNAPHLRGVLTYIKWISNRTYSITNFSLCTICPSAIICTM